MIVVGLTGSIGMGKSTTAAFFEEHGYPVFDADAVVRAAQNPDGVAIDDIEKAFPNTVVDGVLDRGMLGAAVFHNKEALRRLEMIMHPIVDRARRAFFMDAEQQKAKAVILDVPLLFETGMSDKCDLVVVVTANATTQKERVLSREGMTEEKFNNIISHQMPDAEKRMLADVVIDTTDGLDSALIQAQTAIKTIEVTRAQAYEAHWKV